MNPDETPKKLINLSFEANLRIKPTLGSFKIQENHRKQLATSKSPSNGYKQQVRQV